MHSHTRAHTHKHTHTHKHIHTRTRIRTHTRTHIHTHTHTHIHTHIHTHSLAHTSAHTHTRAHTHTHTHKHIHAPQTIVFLINLVCFPSFHGECSAGLAKARLLVPNEATISLFEGPRNLQSMETLMATLTRDIYFQVPQSLTYHKPCQITHAFLQLHLDTNPSCRFSQLSFPFRVKIIFHVVLFEVLITSC